MSNQERPNVALCGFMRSGKDSVARYLVDKCGYIKLSFAGALKEDCATMLASVARERSLLEWLYELKGGPSKESLRGLMQWYGAWRREQYHSYYWVERLVAKMQHYNPAPPFVITDARYTNELETLRAHGFVVIELDMPEYEVVEYLVANQVAASRAQELLGHPSENEWRSFPKDFSFRSTRGNLPELTENIVKALGLRSEQESIRLELEEFFHKLYPELYLSPRELYTEDKR